MILRLLLIGFLSGLASYFIPEWWRAWVLFPACFGWVMADLLREKHGF